MFAIFEPKLKSLLHVRFATTYQPTCQPTNRPTYPTTNPPNYQPTNRHANQPTPDQPTCQPTNRPLFCNFKSLLAISSSWSIRKRQPRRASAPTSVSKYGRESHLLKSQIAASAMGLRSAILRAPAPPRQLDARGAAPSTSPGPAPWPARFRRPPSLLLGLARRQCWVFIPR